MKSIFLQTKAFIPNKKEIIGNLIELGFSNQKSIKLHDIYYCNKDDIDPNLHTFEKVGKTFRIRIIDNKELLVQQLESMQKQVKDKTRFSHDLFTVETVYKGKKKDMQNAVELAIKAEFPHKLIEIKKERTIYNKNDTDCVIDAVSPQVSIFEIQNTLENKSKQTAVKKQQLALFEKLGISEHSIINDGYVHRRISTEINETPDIKMKMLNEELELSIKRLREQEMISGDAFKNTGDGWHENPTYETIWQGILALNYRIIEIKEELIELKKLKAKTQKKTNKT